MCSQQPAHGRNDRMHAGDRKGEQRRAGARRAHREQPGRQFRWQQRFCGPLHGCAHYLGTGTFVAWGVGSSLNAFADAGKRGCPYRFTFSRRTDSMSSLSPQRVPMLVAAMASASGFGCATLPAPDVATVAAAAAAATAATTAASANAAPSAGAAPTPALAPGAARPSAHSPPPQTPPPTPAPPAAAAAVASQQKPFAEVVKDAKEQPGFFNLYSKEEKVWLEIKPDQFDQPFFLQLNRTHGIGDRDPFRSPMLRAYIVEFHRLGSLVQLIARNSQFFATAGTPLARAVRESTSDSLLSAVGVAKPPHPERKSILIDANALLLADIPGGSSALEAAYHIAYGFDARNSSFTALHNTADLTGFSVSAHYSVPELPAAPSMTGPSSTR